MAGRRRVGSCGLDPRFCFASVFPPCPVVIRLTSLFGAACGPDVAVVLDLNMGASEPLLEKFIEGESGPMLDLGLLPCCDRGRIDKRFNHDSLDELESRTLLPVDRSLWLRMNDCLRFPLEGGGGKLPGRCPVELVGCDVRGPGTASKIGSKELCGKYSDCGEVRRTPLVPGRGDARGIGNKSWSWAIFLLDMGRGGSRSGGWPNTRPVVAAATTVPVPTRLGTACILLAGRGDT